MLVFRLNCLMSKTKRSLLSFALTGLVGCVWVCVGEECEKKDDEKKKKKKTQRRFSTVRSCYQVVASRSTTCTTIRACSSVWYTSRGKRCFSAI